MNESDKAFLDELLAAFEPECERCHEYPCRCCEQCNGEAYGISSPGGWTRRCPKCHGTGVQS